MRVRLDRARSRLRRSPLLGAVVLSLVLAAVAATVVLAAQGKNNGSLLSSTGVAGTQSAPPLPATALLSLPPHTITNGTRPLTVTLSAPAAPNSPPPTLHPAVAGSWASVGETLVFTPASTLLPCSTYTLTVWANTVAAGHSPIGHRHTIGLRVACPPLAAMQEALAHLGYLGAHFKSFYVAHLAHGHETRREAAEQIFHPARGVLVPEPSSAPRAALGQLDETTKGALVVYQSDHGIEPTGEPNLATWLSVLAAVSDDRTNPHPYTWVTVSESLPETLEVHRGHHVVFSTPVNTGVPGAETAQGTFPIYSRFVSTTMSGTDVDGTKYTVPDVPWVNYFNGGDAVHGYPRASYGFPQSNGCVELPIEAAHTVFGMLALGDIVVVG